MLFFVFQKLYVVLFLTLQFDFFHDNANGLSLYILVYIGYKGYTSTVLENMVYLIGHFE